MHNQTHAHTNKQTHKQTHTHMIIKYAKDYHCKCEHTHTHDHVQLPILMSEKIDQDKLGLNIASHYCQAQVQVQVK